MNKNSNDLTGKIIGDLTILCKDDRVKNTKSKSQIWKCRCKCGEIIYATQYSLEHNRTKSCGCTITIKKKHRNLIGDKYNYLTVISQGDDIKENDNTSIKGYNIRRTWNCRCDCGKIIYNIPEKRLKSNRIKSCGCMTSKFIADKNKANKQYNKYNLEGEYGIGYSLSGKVFYFDIEDYDKIKNILWNVKPDGYVEGKDGKSYISLHRIIMGNPIEHIDHINHNPSDNRKCNLRKVDRYQNQANSKIRVDNTSGTKGVSYNKGTGLWVASLQEHNNKHSKSFKDKESAVKYREYLEEKYQKEYSYKESMKSKAV